MNPGRATVSSALIAATYKNVFPLGCRHKLQSEPYLARCQIRRNAMTHTGGIDALHMVTIIIRLVVGLWIVLPGLRRRLWDAKNIRPSELLFDLYCFKRYHPRISGAPDSHHAGACDERA